MIHWGLYSIIGGEWKGKRMDQIAEWAQSYFRIPNEEYGRLAQVFNPTFFQAEEWVKLAKAAGMKYIVVTSKHHEGFAMFKSDVGKFNIYDATPFKRDVIAEFAEACKKHDMKLGLYYSQALDWHDPNGAGYAETTTSVGGMHWSNDWDYPDCASKNYAVCFENKIKPQLKEILTRYGELFLIWFDVPLTITPQQSKELYDLVKQYQPNCLVNGRLGNGYGDYNSAGDNQLDYKNDKEAICEVPATLNDTWGFKYYDNNWKSAKRLFEIKTDLNQKGINYLLNVGPDYLGRIPAPAIDILTELGKMKRL